MTTNLRQIWICNTTNAIDLCYNCSLIFFIKTMTSKVALSWHTYILLLNVTRLYIHFNITYSSQYVASKQSQCPMLQFCYIYHMWHSWLSVSTVVAWRKLPKWQCHFWSDRFDNCFSLMQCWLYCFWYFKYVSSD